MHHLVRGLAARHRFFCTLPELPYKLQALAFLEAVAQTIWLVFGLIVVRACVKYVPKQSIA